MNNKEYLTTLQRIRTRIFLLDGCLIRKYESGDLSLDLLNAREHLEVIKEILKDTGVVVYD